MRNREMKRLTAALEKMTPGQRKVLATELMALELRSASVTVVESRLASGPTCPHCAAERVVKNGTARGLQRFKYRECGKMFCALTGTPLAHLHMRGKYPLAHKWPDQAAALRDGLTLHEVAENLNIAVSTAFRWRHRFLALPKTVQAQALIGIAEADETYFLRPNKGRRKGLGRPARERGLSGKQVPVLVVHDRSGSTADFILEIVDKAHVSAVLKPLLAQDAILCTDSSKALATAAMDIGVMHHPVNLAAGIRVDGPWHVQNVNAYHSRLKNWMRRFKGVATRYMDSYLGWFRTIDRSPLTGLKPAQWLTMAVGV